MKSIQLYDGTFTTFQAVLDLNEIKYELFEPSLNNAIVIDPENVKKFLIFALELSSLATINSNKKIHPIEFNPTYKSTDVTVWDVEDIWLQVFYPSKYLNLVKKHSKK